jgi:hypothetical protein
MAVFPLPRLAAGSLTLLAAACVLAQDKKAKSNRVVCDDGRFMAFQLARSTEAAGIGHGILAFDLAMDDKTKQVRPKT